ncbi:hypothetical protein DM01DRAFT_348291, partial [Hesseltinella vesiculosa]
MSGQKQATLFSFFKQKPAPAPPKEKHVPEQLPPNPSPPTPSPCSPPASTNDMELDSVNDKLLSKRQRGRVSYKELESESEDDQVVQNAKSTTKRMKRIVFDDDDDESQDEFKPADLSDADDGSDGQSLLDEDLALDFLDESPIASRSAPSTVAVSPLQERFKVRG